MWRARVVGPVALIIALLFVGLTVFIVAAVSAYSAGVSLKGSFEDAVVKLSRESSEVLAARSQVRARTVLDILSNRARQYIMESFAVDAERVRFGRALCEAHNLNLLRPADFSTATATVLRQLERSADADTVNGWRLRGRDPFFFGDSSISTLRLSKLETSRTLFVGLMNATGANGSLLGWDPTIAPLRSSANLPAIDWWFDNASLMTVLSSKPSLLSTFPNYFPGKAPTPLTGLPDNLPLVREDTFWVHLKDYTPVNTMTCPWRVGSIYVTDECYGEGSLRSRTFSECLLTSSAPPLSSSGSAGGARKVFFCQGSLQLPYSGVQFQRAISGRSVTSEATVVVVNLTLTNALYGYDRTRTHGRGLGLSDPRGGLSNPFAECSATAPCESPLVGIRERADPLARPGGGDVPESEAPPTAAFSSGEGGGGGAGASTTVPYPPPSSDVNEVVFGDRILDDTAGEVTVRLPMSDRTVHMTNLFADRTLAYKRVMGEEAVGGTYARQLERESVRLYVLFHDLSVFSASTGLADSAIESNAPLSRMRIPVPDLTQPDDFGNSDAATRAPPDGSSFDTSGSDTPPITPTTQSGGSTRLKFSVTVNDGVAHALCDALKAAAADDNFGAFVERGDCGLPILHPRRHHGYVPLNDTMTTVVFNATSGGIDYDDGRGVIGGSVNRWIGRAEVLKLPDAVCAHVDPDCFESLWVVVASPQWFTTHTSILAEARLRAQQEAELAVGLRAADDARWWLVVEFGIATFLSTLVGSLAAYFFLHRVFKRVAREAALVASASTLRIGAMRDTFLTFNLELPSSLAREADDDTGVSSDLRADLLLAAAEKSASDVVYAELADLGEAVRQLFRGVVSLMKFVPEEVALRYASTGVGAQLGMVRSRSTILVSDIIGFTTFCEGTALSVVLSVMSSYFSAMSDCIHITGGAIDQFVGDAVIAAWTAASSRSRAAAAADSTLLANELGADEDTHPDPGLAAITTVCNMLGVIERRSSAWGGLKARIGVHSGSVYIGNMGSLLRMNYTHIGDTVDAAGHLEAACATLDSSALISQAVVSESPAVLDLFPLRPVAIAALPGVDALHRSSRRSDGEAGGSRPSTAAKASSDASGRPPTRSQNTRRGALVYELFLGHKLLARYLDLMSQTPGIRLSAAYSSTTGPIVSPLSGKELRDSSGCVMTGAEVAMAVNGRMSDARMAESHARPSWRSSPHTSPVGAGGIISPGSPSAGMLEDIHSVASSLPRRSSTVGALVDVEGQVLSAARPQSAFAAAVLSSNKGANASGFGGFETTSVTHSVSPRSSAALEPRVAASLPLSQLEESTFVFSQNGSRVPMPRPSGGTPTGFRTSGHSAFPKFSMSSSYHSVSPRVSRRYGGDRTSSAVRFSSSMAASGSRSVGLLAGRYSRLFSLRAVQERPPVDLLSSEELAALAVLREAGLKLLDGWAETAQEALKHYAGTKGTPGGLAVLAGGGGQTATSVAIALRRMMHLCEGAAFLKQAEADLVEERERLADMGVDQVPARRGSVAPQGVATRLGGVPRVGSMEFRPTGWKDQVVEALRAGEEDRVRAELCPWELPFQL